MNFILVLNEFYNKVQEKPLSPSAHLIYIVLLKESYSCDEYFYCPNSYLCMVTGVHMNELKRAIQELKQVGLIDCRQDEDAMGLIRYKIINICS